MPKNISYYNITGFNFYQRGGVGGGVQRVFSRIDNIPKVCFPII
jgi:hypothetical protein